MNRISNIQTTLSSFAATPQQRAGQKVPSLKADTVQFSGKNKGGVVVQGLGNVRVKPDQMTIRLNVNLDDSSLESLNRRLTTNVGAILEGLGGLNLPSWVERQDQRNAQARYDHRAQQNNGYQGTYSVTLKARQDDMAALSKVARDLSDLGERLGVEFHGPNFSLSPEKARESATEALEAALTDAKNKAQIAARTLGFNLDDIPHEVVIGDANSSGHQRLGRSAGLEMAMADGGGGMPEGGFEAMEIPVSAPPVSIRFLTQKAK